MKQVVQNIRNGQLKVMRLPDPMSQPGRLLIANRASLISAGTEKMVMQIAKKSLLGKARERPDQVRRVLQKIRTEGVLETLRQVREKLDQPMNLGYCSAGVVIACGAGVTQFKVGDRVASNGPHSDLVSVPPSLSARLPDNVGFEQGAFAVLGSVALHGVRLSRAALGETVLVVGLGLVGQLAVGLLRAAGCRVLGTDPDPSKCALAMQSGADIAHANMSAAEVMTLTGGLGADAVIITASTSSNQPIEFACEAVRAKGRIVLVGVVGLELPRRPMYFKEAEFLVSCSYGPGRYDPDYEERGHDYPAAYVRWTEQRNLQAVLDLIGHGSLRVDHLISHRFSIENGEAAFRLVEQGHEPYLGVVLNYGDKREPIPVVESQARRPDPIARRIRLGVLGAGNFARMTMFPALSRCNAFELSVVCSANSLSATSSMEKSGFSRAVGDDQQVIADPNIDALMILTRHDQHARQVVAGLQAGKHVFVEKPLAITWPELEQIEDTVQERGDRILMVGFNRRFSEAAVLVREFYSRDFAPLTISYRFNAGAIPREHWVQSSLEGGGRLIGEACHAIDLVTFLTGSLPVEVYAASVGGPHAPTIVDDQAFITLRHANGSISSIGYLAGGNAALGKERIEVHAGGKSAVLDDFQSVELYSNGKRKVHRLRTGKGHGAEVEAFARGLQAGTWPIPWEELRTTTLAAIACVMSLREGVPIPLFDETNPNCEDTGQSSQIEHRE